MGRRFETQQKRETLLFIPGPSRKLEVSTTLNQVETKRRFLERPGWFAKLSFPSPPEIKRAERSNRGKLGELGAGSPLRFAAEQACTGCRRHQVFQTAPRGLKKGRERTV